jgi:uncharacterized protein YaiL (DUF2058 family)
MSESLRDQLLKSGLARKFKSEPPRSKPAQGRPAGPSPGSPRAPAPPRRERSEIDLAKAYALRDSTERAERERVQREAELRAREKKERKQRLAAVLTGKAENAQNADIPRHFPHANKIRRIYVTPEQLPRLNGGELGVVQLGGRYLLVTREVAEAAREIDAEALVLLCDAHENASDDDVPSDLVW